MRSWATEVTSVVLSTGPAGRPPDLVVGGTGTGDTASALAYFGATLTLPGIAGIILSIGMSVDANVLIFERIKEERGLGKTIPNSIAQGFSRAFTAIFDSNLTTIISAIFLFQFGTGPIKGYAVTLIIGLVSNVFTAVFVSRLIFDVTVRKTAKSLSI